MDATTTKSRTFYRYAFNCVLNDPVFALRNKAVRMGITSYNLQTTNNHTALIKYTDINRFGVMYAVEYSRFKDIYECFVNDVNTSYCKRVSIEECDEYNEICSGNFTITRSNGFENDTRYMVIPSLLEDERLVSHLEDRGINNISMNILRDYINDDILYYQVEDEDEEEDEEDDDEPEGAFKSDSCPICYESWSEVYKTYLSCKHSVCKKCVRHLTTNSCPICRVEFDKPPKTITTFERTNTELLNFMSNQTSQEICNEWITDIELLAEDLLEHSKIEDLIENNIIYDITLDDNYEYISKICKLTDDFKVLVI